MDILSLLSRSYVLIYLIKGILLFDGENIVRHRGVEVQRNSEHLLFWDGGMDTLSHPSRSYVLIFLIKAILLFNLFYRLSVRSLKIQKNMYMYIYIYICMYTFIPSIKVLCPYLFEKGNIIIWCTNSIVPLRYVFDLLFVNFLLWVGRLVLWILSYAFIMIRIMTLIRIQFLHVRMQNKNHLLPQLLKIKA
jgi:hypothetical protein